MKLLCNKLINKHAVVKRKDQFLLLRSSLFFCNCYVKASYFFTGLLLFLSLLSATSYSQYTGGSYDGFTFSVNSCPSASSNPLASIYTGGSYDGYALGNASCAPAAPPSITGTVAYTGGA